jgi:hypothetical protein
VKGNIPDPSLAELSRSFSIHNSIRIDLSNMAVAILFSPHYERYHRPEQNDYFVARNDIIVSECIFLGGSLTKPVVVVMNILPTAPVFKMMQK